MKTRTSERYCAIINGIQSLGLNVSTTIEKIRVTCPETGRQVFEGNIETAERWLMGRDFPKPMQPNMGKFITVETPPFRRNAILCFSLCIAFILGATLLDHNPGTLLLGLPGVALLAIAFSNVSKHLKWEKKFLHFRG